MIYILPIDKNSIPYSANYRIKGETFTFTYNYNIEGDFFTVDLEQNGTILAQGEKIVYGRPLFMAYLTEDFPLRPIIPLDFSGKSERVGWDGLQEDVFLYVGGDPT